MTHEREPILIIDIKLTRHEIEVLDKVTRRLQICQYYRKHAAICNDARHRYLVHIPNGNLESLAKKMQIDGI